MMSWSGVGQGAKERLKTIKSRIGDGSAFFGDFPRRLQREIGLYEWNGFGEAQ